jgi:hypothetical protein
VRIGDLKSLTNSVAHQFGHVASHAGDGDSWTYRASDGSETRYQFDGIKSLEGWATDLGNALVLLWSAKDWIKAAQTSGRGQGVERHVDTTPVLALCADLANLYKHSALRTSRSGLWPRFGTVCMIAPQETFQQIWVCGGDVGAAFQRPELIEYRLPVLDKSGVREIAEAGDVAQRSWTAWQDYMRVEGLLKT